MESRHFTSLSEAQSFVVNGTQVELQIGEYLFSRLSSVHIVVFEDRNFTNFAGRISLNSAGRLCQLSVCKGPNYYRLEEFISFESIRIACPDSVYCALSVYIEDFCGVCTVVRMSLKKPFRIGVDCTSTISVDCAVSIFASVKRYVG